jgi:hypothetical protein
MIRHLKYARYILRHKWFVFQAGLKLKVPLGILLSHDLSKLLPDEWFAYANFFYADGDQSAFNKAWLRHQKRNKHHWQYWVLINDTDGIACLPIPDKYCREMLADWVGAGMAISGRKSPAAWYMKHKNKIMLHDDTRTWVEDTLEAMYE